MKPLHAALRSIGGALGAERVLDDRRASRGSAGRGVVVASRIASRTSGVDAGARRAPSRAAASAERRGAAADAALADARCAPLIHSSEVSSVIGQLVVGHDALGERRCPSPSAAGPARVASPIAVTSRAYVGDASRSGVTASACSMHRERAPRHADHAALVVGEVDGPDLDAPARPTRGRDGGEHAVAHRADVVGVELDADDGVALAPRRAAPPMLAADSASSAETPPCRMPNGWWTFGPTGEAQLDARRASPRRPRRRGARGCRSSRRQRTARPVVGMARSLRRGALRGVHRRPPCSIARVPRARGPAERHGHASRRAAMRRAMADAVVGDDGYGEDPTVTELEEAYAEWVGKPAAVFVPSGVMANQIALRVLMRPRRRRRRRRACSTSSPSSSAPRRRNAGDPVPHARRRDGPARPGGRRARRSARSATTSPQIGALVAREHAHGVGRHAAHRAGDRRGGRRRGAAGRSHLDGARLCNAAVALGCDAGRARRPGDDRDELPVQGAVRARSARCSPGPADVIARGRDRAQAPRRRRCARRACSRPPASSRCARWSTGSPRTTRARAASPRSSPTTVAPGYDPSTCRTNVVCFDAPRRRRRCASGLAAQRRARRARCRADARAARHPRRRRRRGSSTRPSTRSRRSERTWRAAPATRGPAGSARARPSRCSPRRGAGRTCSPGCSRPACRPCGTAWASS